MLVTPAPSLAVVEPEATDDTDTDRSTLASKTFFGGRGGMHDVSFPTCFKGGGCSGGDGLAIAVEGCNVPFPVNNQERRGAQESRPEV